MKKLLLKVVNSLWFIPSMYSVFGLLIAIVVVYIDQNYVDKFPKLFPDILLTSVDLATTISTVLSTALITMTTFTFSISMVVLTTYTSQFSPRVLPNFITDKKTARVLGVFMGGFIYSIFSLLFMRKSLDNQLVISAFIGVIIAIICLLFFIYFINHVGKSIQVDLLIEKLSKEVTEIGLRYKRLMLRDALEIVQTKSAHYIKSYSNEFLITAKSTGYIQQIDIEDLIKISKDNDLFISLSEPIGEYVTLNTVLVKIHTNKNNLDIVIEDSIIKCITLNSVRNSTQDLSYAFQKIIEIALRATSSAINDPYTAKHCIRNVGKVMGEISWLTEGDLIFKDAKKVPRLFFPVLELNELLYITFNELELSGKENISSVNSVIDALIITAKQSSRQNRETIWKFVHYIINDKLHSLHTYDKEYLDKKIKLLHELTHRETMV